jgi:hypothetical protein
VKNTKLFQSGENANDFSKWSYCNGQPSEKYKDFSKWLKMRMIF